MNKNFLSKKISYTLKQIKDILDNKLSKFFYSAIIFTLLLEIVVISKIPLSFLIILVACYICSKFVSFCNNKLIGFCYILLTVSVCNIPAYLILKTVSKDIAITRFPDYIHHNLFYFSLIFISLLAVLFFKGCYQKIKPDRKSFFINSLLTIILFSPITISICYLLNWSLNNPVLETDTILAVYQTNFSEANSYISGYLNVKKFIVFFIFTLAYIFLCYKMADSINISSIKKQFLKNTCLFLFICLPIISVSLTKYSNNMVTRIFYEANKMLDNYKLFNNLVATRENVIKDLSLSNDGFNGTFVLVIGESETRTEMGVYGYSKDNTPWQSEIIHSKNSIFFDNAYSCHTHTVPVLTYALTQKNQYENNSLEWEKTVSIIDMAKYLGEYNTTWISNQGKIGLYETPISSIANSSDQQFWTDNNRTYIDNIIFDEELVNYIDDIKLSPQKNLIVIHLMGCHGTYSSRYPAKYNNFTDENNIINSYNNAIFYNDLVLKKIYEKVKKLHNFKAMIYISDHGEDAFRNLGHNSSSFTWDMAKIPFWMIFSDSYINEHKEIFDTLSNNKNTPFTNDMLFETMLGVMGMTHSDYYYCKNDLSSESYNHNNFDLKTLYGTKNLSDQPSTDEINKLWLHRVNSPKKLLEFGNNYNGLEFDVIFHDDKNDFENSHDETSLIEFPLEKQLESLLILNNGTNKHLWIDFKNLTHKNKYNAERRLDELFKKYNIKKENCYIESNNWEALKVFIDRGWKTSYYFPYYDFSKLSDKEINDIKILTKKISYSGYVSAISFAQEYYDFVTDLDLNPNIDLLTWFNLVQKSDFLSLDKYFPVIKNPRIKVILVKDLGHYTR